MSKQQELEARLQDVLTVIQLRFTDELAWLGRYWRRWLFLVAGSGYLLVCPAFPVCSGLAWRRVVRVSRSVVVDEQCRSCCATGWSMLVPRASVTVGAGRVAVVDAPVGRGC